MTPSEQERTFARPPRPLWRVGYAGLWVAVVLGPWLALATVLHRVNFVQTCTRASARTLPLAWALLPDPFSEVAVRASFGVGAALGVSLLVLLVCERRRVRMRPPWIEAGWVAFLGAPACLGLAGVFWADRVLARQPLLVDLQASAVADARALAWTSVALCALVALLPSLALWVAGRALRRGRGTCTIGPEQVRFRPLGLLPWTLELPKHCLGARALTSRGVRVAPPRGPALLIPTASAEQAEEVLRLLDDHTPPDAVLDSEPRWLRRAAVCALAIPTALAVCRLGPEWAVPAFGLALALEAPALWALARRPGRRAGLALLATGAVATLCAAADWPLYRVTWREQDLLGNSLIVVARLGDPDYCVLLGEPPAELRLPGWRSLHFEQGRPGVVLDLAAGRVDGPNPATLLGSPKLVVHTVQDTWETSPQPLRLGYHEAERIPDVPGYLANAVPGRSFADPVLARFCDGRTSTVELQVEDYLGERLYAAIEGGNVRYVVAASLHARRPVFERRDGALRLARVGRWGWQPNDPGRLLWLGPYGPGGGGILAFPGEPPGLDVLEAVAARVKPGGALLAFAGRLVLPFWELEPAPGLSHATCREIGLRLREGEGYFLSPAADRELRGTHGLGAHGLGLGTPAGTALRERIAAEALRSPVARTRCAALRTLYGTPQETGCALVRAALSDPAPEVREQALRLAAEGRFGEDWVQAALEAARADPAPDVRRVAEALLARR